MSKKSNAKRAPLTAGQKAARTKGKNGLAMAGHKAAITRLTAKLTDLVGKERAEVTRAIKAHKAELKTLAA